MAKIRQPVVAGVFYPGAREQLVDEVDGYLREADEPPREAVVAVSPHAGYIYSGKVAGEVMGLVQVPDRVMVLGPKHRARGERNAVSDAEAWRFPFGDVPVDRELADLAVQKAGAAFDDQAHAEEHSLEVQIPFLWRRNPRLRITPIALGMHHLRELEEIGRGLAAAIRSLGEPVLIVASTDMSHQIPQSEAERLDGLAIQRILALDAAGLLETVIRHDISMCGVIPTTAALIAARELGATQAELVRYRTSGDVTGDLRHVVGYAGLTIR